MDDISARYEQAKGGNTIRVGRRVYVGPDSQMQAIYLGDVVEWDGRLWRVVEHEGQLLLRVRAEDTEDIAARGLVPQVRLITVGTVQTTRV